LGETGHHRRSSKNPFDYLTNLLRHPAEIAVHPAEWMPWNYRRDTTNVTAYHWSGGMTGKDPLRPPHPTKTSLLAILNGENAGKTGV
jgi:hypothetical protein